MNPENQASAVDHLHAHGPHCEDLGETYKREASAGQGTNNLPAGEDQIIPHDHGVSTDDNKGQNEHSGTYPGVIRKIK